jgi:acyl transferase
MVIQKICEYSSEDKYSMENLVYAIYHNRNQKLILFESKTSDLNPKGNVLIIPPYGVNAHSLYLLGYYFVANGYHVYRFDGIDSVGLGTGKIENYKLSQLILDVELVFCTFLKNSELPNFIISQSLSFPVALKFLAKNKTIANTVEKLVAIVGVTNVLDTLKKVTGANFECYLSKDPDAPKYIRIFGYDVIAQDFISDLQDLALVDFADMNRTLNDISTPIEMISSVQDEYVAYEEVIQCSENHNHLIALRSIEKSGHMIGRSLAILKKMAILALEAIAGKEFTNDMLPPITETIKYASLESRYFKAHVLVPDSNNMTKEESDGKLEMER